MKKSFIGYAFIFIGAGITAILSDHLLWYILPFVALTVPLVIEHPRFLFVLLIFSLPLSMEYQVTSSLGTDFPDEFLMIGVTGVFIAFGIHQPEILKNINLRHPLFYLLLVHLLWIVITCIFSEQPILSTKYLLAKIWYILPFSLFIQIFLLQRRSILVISICLVLPMCLIIAQALIRHAVFGFTFESVNKTVVPFFRNHVNYSSMLACMFPIVLGLLKHTSQPKYRRLLQGALILLTAGIILSYARGAWLALFLGAVVYFAIRKKLIKWFFLFSVIVIVTGFTWLGQNNRYLDYRPNFNITIFHTNFLQHMTATYQLRDLSTAERFYRWIAAIRLTADHPITGVGPNNFYGNYKPYTVSAYKTWVSRNNEHSTVHNYFLFTMCEQGIPGMIIFTILLFACFYYAENLYHKTADPQQKTVAITVGSILAIITTVNFLSDLIETDKVGSLFFMCIGVLMWLDNPKLKTKN